MLLFSLMKVVLNFKWFNGWVWSLKHKYSLNFSKLPQRQVTGVVFFFFWTIEDSNSGQSFHCCKEVPFCYDICVGGFLKINSKFCKILLVRESILSLDSWRPCPRKMKNPASPCFLWGFLIPSWWFCHWVFTEHCESVFDTSVGTLHFFFVVFMIFLIFLVLELNHNYWVSQTSLFCVPNHPRHRWKNDKEEILH